MPLVSVLIPAYNAEQYVGECLDSVVNQTLRDIEIVVVDDCSTDGTPEILAAYAAKDKRIKVFRNEKNGGTFFARYRAFSCSSGEYILFLDADDLLEAEACEELSAEMQKSGWDVLNFGASILPDQSNDDKQTERLEQDLSVPTGPFPYGQGAMLNLLAGGNTSNSLWNKMYTRAVVEQAFGQYRGERLVVAEDLLLMSMVLAYASSFGSVQKEYYRYRMNSGVTAMKSGISPDSAEQFASAGHCFSLLREWLPKTGLPEECISEMLESERLHSSTIAVMLHFFFERVSPDLCPDMLSRIMEYMTPAEFGAEVDRFVFQEKLVPPEKAAVRLRGAFVCKAAHEIKTVALFYRRYFNGGIQRVMSLLTPILMNSGYRVIIVTETGPTEEDYPLPDHVLHIRLDADDENRFHAWEQVIREHNIDCVVYNAWIGKHVIQDSLAIKSCGITLILHTHGSMVFQYLLPIAAGKEQWFCQKEAYSLYDMVLTLSAPDQAWCSALGIRSTQVDNPLTFSLRETVPATLDGLRVLWVGRLSKEKQYEDAFEIARMVHERIPGAEFHFVGRTEEQETMAQIAESLRKREMSGYVVLDGYHEDMRADYSAASVYLCTSKFEGFSMSIQEAKVYGLPIVSYELPNLTLYREPDSGVFMIPQGNICLAAERLVTLLGNAELRKDAGKKSREDIERLYDYDLAERWREILTLACEKASPETPAYLCAPLDTEIRMAMQNLYIGINKTLSSYRSKIASFERKLNALQEKKARYEQKIADLQEKKVRYKRKIADLQEKKVRYKRKINELQSSCSYRIGHLIIWPLGKVMELYKRFRASHKK